MNSPDKPNDRILFKYLPVKLVPLLAPAILVVVACIQVLLASTGKLSPWKGGGFGMFSTIESSSTRIIRINLVSEDVRIPVELPGQYKKLAAKIRERPTQSDIDELAKVLSASTWTSRQVLPEKQNYYSLHKKYFPSSTLTADTAGGDTNIEKQSGERQVVHIVPRGETADHPLQFDRVEVECLQIMFEKAKHKLVLRQIAKAQKHRDGNLSK